MTNKKKTEKNKEWEVKFAPSFFESANKLFSNNLRYLIPRKLSDWKYEIKWAWQRVFNGYDDRITWGLDFWLSENLPKILRTLKDNVHGYPASGKSGMKNVKQWKAVLEKIAKGFDSANKLNNSEYMKTIKLKKPKKDMFGEDSYTDYKFDQKIYDKLYKEFKEGMKLFEKHFFSLWD